MRTGAGDDQERTQTTAESAAADRAAGILQVGTKLGKYLITGKLGKGGMGEVFKAEDTALGAGLPTPPLRPTAGLLSQPRAA